MAQDQNQVVLSPDDYQLPEEGHAAKMIRADIDTQISTAKAYPRKLKEVKNDIHSLVTLDVRTAQECQYALPRGKGENAKPILGPSIRFAEIVASQYGNCRVASQIVAVDRKEKVIIAEGAFHDMEKNVITRKQVFRRISDKYGKLYSDDMIAVTGNAAASIALRNAVLAGVPRALYWDAYEAAQKVMTGGQKTLAEMRFNAIKEFAAFGVKPEQIFEVLGKAGQEDVDLDDLRVLGAMINALRSGEATKEEYFPAKVVEPAKTATAGDALTVTDADKVKRKAPGEPDAKVKKIEIFEHGEHHAIDGFDRMPPSGISAEDVAHYNSGYDHGLEILSSEKPAAEAVQANEAEAATDTPDDGEADASATPDKPAATQDAKPEPKPAAKGNSTGYLDEKKSELSLVGTNWTALDRAITTIFKEPKFATLRSTDGHLALYEFIRTLPAWEKADTAAMNYKAVSNDY